MKSIEHFKEPIAETQEAIQDAILRSEACIREFDNDETVSGIQVKNQQRQLLCMLYEELDELSVIKDEIIQSK